MNPTQHVIEILSENTQIVNKLAKSYIKAGSKIHADENSAYDELIANYDLHRVNHQKEYSDEGITNNLAESYFSHVKRMIKAKSLSSLRRKGFLLF